ncbi:MAG: cysteine--tRNA ligase [Nanoarchaeota archaeon]|nr:cysteine--tRNA ligase [Nanoarchaeota archaeon]
MKLSLYNTLSRKKEEFKPIKKGQVGYYSCGPTVYWYQHIGNLRTYVFNDILKRILLFNGYKVKQVMNVTDVGHLTSDADEGEDKIEQAAQKEGKKAEEIANRYWKVFKEDFKKLNITEPDIWCKATEHIKEQLEMIKKLEKKGYTYKTSDGIYFDTSKLKDYGKLARIKKEGLEAGKRVDIGEKKNKTDFALWKFSKEPGIRQQEWDSKFGLGFPGWHIECSAMSSKYLGEQFDIHTGGEDHIQIHHTNEIAQSESAFGKKPWVKYWLHGAFLTFKGEKVSKSKGGLFTISELEEKKFEPLSYRYFCLTVHYHKPLSFSLEALKGAQNSFHNLKNKILELLEEKDKTKTKIAKLKKYGEEFHKEINNDLNMPKALAVLWTMLKDKNVNSKDKYKLILEFDKIFGLNLEKLKKEEEKTSKDIKKLVEEREKARKKKDWKKADKIRDQLKEKGIILEDTPEGVRWKKT